jgi:hypothetical protein
LRGDEIRACWEASTVPIEVEPDGPVRTAPPPYHPVDDGTSVRKLEFVEVGAVPAKAPRRGSANASAAESDTLTPSEPLAPVSPGEPRWSLWGDAEV